MTLSTLIISFAVVGLLLTVLMKMFTKRVNNVALSFLQNFCGAWFVFSGWVKAIDPLGTAYKMEQYFAQFESTFSETWLSFIAPIFPFLTEYQNGFSVFMIILEIVLGFALIIGFRPKLTAWTFFIIMFFFTFLTGFTHLTGYVPNDANFFDFSKWGEFKETQMRVTDCGCFGDFLKLEPFTSFLKDCALMIPAIIFLLMSKSFHRIFSTMGRGAVMGISTIGLLLYCWSNYAWDLPHTDFRPFAEDVHLRDSKLAQEEAMSSTKILNYIVTNKETGKTLVIPYDQYLKEFKNYPKEDWNLEQDVSEPVIPINKLSEFEVADADGNDVTEELLNEPGYSFMIVAHKIKDKRNVVSKMVQDTTYVQDTIQVEGMQELQIVKKVDKVTPREVSETTYTFNDDYLKKWISIINPVVKEGKKAGMKVYGITAPSDAAKLSSFQKAIAVDYPIYTADDILLKTIVRSNPGVVLLKDGKILKKWHYNKLPDFASIKTAYMK